MLLVQFYVVHNQEYYYSTDTAAFYGLRLGFTINIMSWFLRFHYLAFFPVILMIPFWYVKVFQAIPWDSTDDMADGFAGMILLLFYFVFFVGQIVLFALIRTRSDVRLSRTFGGLEALLLTLLYALILLLPFFVPGYDAETEASINSLAAQHLGVLFYYSSNTVQVLLLLAIPLVYVLIYCLVVYERFRNTAVEIHLPD